MHCALIEAVQVSHESWVLRLVQERRRVTLAVIPKRIGTLQITGLRWKLFGEVCP